MADALIKCGVYLTKTTAFFYRIPCLMKNQQSVTNINIIPYRGGPRCVVVDLRSKKFSDIKGTLPINVSSE